MIFQLSILFAILMLALALSMFIHTYQSRRKIFSNLQKFSENDNGIEGKATLEMNSLAQVAEVLHGLRTLDVNVIDFNLHSPNLSDAFLALTGHTLRDQVL